MREYFSFLPAPGNRSFEIGTVRESNGDPGTCSSWGLEMKRSLINAAAVWNEGIVLPLKPRDFIRDLYSGPSQCQTIGKVENRLNAFNTCIIEDISSNIAEIQYKKKSTERNEPTERQDCILCHIIGRRHPVVERLQSPERLVRIQFV